MGLDGGTIASRTDVLRRASWRLATKDGGAHRSTRGGQLGAVEATAASGVEGRSRLLDETDAFSTCALSGTALPPCPAPGQVVACGLGQLYLRDSVVLYLTRSERFAPDATDRAALDAVFGHIGGLRDVFPLTLEPNPRRLEPVPEGGPGPSAEAVGAWRCPVDSSVETNGRYPFGALRPCGHVVSWRVATELAKLRRGGGGGGSGETRVSDGISSVCGGAWECPVCMAPVEVLVHLAPPAEDVEKCRATLLAGHAARAERKRKRKPKPTRAEAASLS